MKFRPSFQAALSNFTNFFLPVNAVLSLYLAIHSARNGGGIASYVWCFVFGINLQMLAQTFVEKWARRTRENDLKTITQFTVELRPWHKSDNMEHVIVTGNINPATDQGYILTDHENPQKELYVPRSFIDFFHDDPFAIKYFGEALKHSQRYN